MLDLKEMRKAANERKALWQAWGWAQKDPAMVQLSDEMWTIWGSVDVAETERHFDFISVRTSRNIPEPSVFFEMALAADNALIGLGLQGIKRCEEQ